MSKPRILGKRVRPLFFQMEKPPRDFRTGALENPPSPKVGRGGEREAPSSEGASFQVLIVFQRERSVFLLHVHGDLPEHGDDDASEPVDAERDEDFRNGRSVLGDGFEHVGHEAADEQAEALVDPRGDHEEDKGPGQDLVVVAQRPGGSA